MEQELEAPMAAVNELWQQENSSGHETVRLIPRQEQRNHIDPERGKIYGNRFTI